MGRSNDGREASISITRDSLPPGCVQCSRCPLKRCRPYIRARELDDYDWLPHDMEICALGKRIRAIGILIFVFYLVGIAVTIVSVVCAPTLVATFGGEGAVEEGLQDDLFHVSGVCAGTYLVYTTTKLYYMLFMYLLQYLRYRERLEGYYRAGSVGRKPQPPSLKGLEKLGFLLRRLRPKK